MSYVMPVASPDSQRPVLPNVVHRLSSPTPESRLWKHSQAESPPASSRDGRVDRRISRDVLAHAHLITPATSDGRRNTQHDVSALLTFQDGRTGILRHASAPRTVSEMRMMSAPSASNVLTASREPSKLGVPTTSNLAPKPAESSRLSRSLGGSLEAPVERSEEVPVTSVAMIRQSSVSDPHETLSARNSASKAAAPPLCAGRLSRSLGRSFEAPAHPIADVLTLSSDASELPTETKGTRSPNNRLPPRRCFGGSVEVPANKSLRDSLEHSRSGGYLDLPFQKVADFPPAPLVTLPVPIPLDALQTPFFQNLVASSEPSLEQLFELPMAIDPPPMLTLQPPNLQLQHNNQISTHGPGDPSGTTRTPVEESPKLSWAHSGTAAVLPGSKKINCEPRVAMIAEEEEESEADSAECFRSPSPVVSETASAIRLREQSPKSAANAHCEQAMPQQKEQVTERRIQVITPEPANSRASSRENSRGPPRGSQRLRSNFEIPRATSASSAPGDFGAAKERKQSPQGSTRQQQRVPPGRSPVVLAKAAAVETDVLELRQQLLVLQERLQRQDQALQKALTQFLQPPSKPELSLGMAFRSMTARFDALDRRITEEAKSRESAVARLDENFSTVDKRFKESFDAELRSAVERAELHIAIAELRESRMKATAPAMLMAKPVMPGPAKMPWTFPPCLSAPETKSESFHRGGDDLESLRSRLDMLQTDLRNSMSSGNSPEAGKAAASLVLQEVGKQTLGLKGANLEDMPGLTHEPCSSLATSWSNLIVVLAAAESGGKGNRPSALFERSWEALARLASSSIAVIVSGAPDAGIASLCPPEEAPAAVRHLLDVLSVGFVNSRSPAFFAVHGRLLLRGPCAMALQLAATVLSKEERECIALCMRDILQRPEDFPDRIWSHTQNGKDRFLSWVKECRHVQNAGGGDSDVILSFVDVESTPESVQDQGRSEEEYDERAELGRFIHIRGGGASDGEETFWRGMDITTVLRAVLALPQQP